jgi:hypothetical protein
MGRLRDPGTRASEQPFGQTRNADWPGTSLVADSSSTSNSALARPADDTFRKH